MSTVYGIASCIIGLSHEKGNPVSNLKLQKLVYYAQAWYLAFYGKPLFDEEVEAWVHGPVVPSVFRRYREYKWAPIDAPVEVCAGSASAHAKDHVEKVWQVYGKLNAFDLERLTHSEGPWQAARHGLSPDESSHAVITKDSMRTYYALRLRA